MDLGLTDKKALVAGGGRGIGKAIAMELAREGADVVVASRSHDELERTAQEIADATGRSAYPLAFDVTNTEQVNWGVKQAAALLGGLHILVNSAALPGGSPEAIGPVETVDEEILKWDFDVKFVGALRLAKAAIPFLKAAGWGRIINISGGNARVAGNLSGGARNVSMVHFTKSLSIQLGRHGITVNCIHPGTTRTERTPVMYAERGESWAWTPPKSSGKTLPPALPPPTPSVAWWTLRRLATWRLTWPPTKPGPSPARCWQPAAASATPSTTNARQIPCRGGSRTARSHSEKRRIRPRICGD